ncbi:MAG: AbrB/MazE/SpoVT family DNA-binding domain-containing protein [Chloroflexi bacterium]|nr:AbrB/MazE/SpoVT family DNA-binding domain-containing protein [Chloroflexota bacterium]
MMQSKVSVRGQTVVPHEIRKILGITPQTLLQWEVQDGVVVVYPIPADPVRASLGALKGKWTFDEFLKERQEERRRELAQEQKA